jgi:hypothetical protein
MSTDTSQDMSKMIIAAFEAVSAGSASPEQEALRSAALAAIALNLDCTELVETLRAAVGPFAAVYEAPYEELSPLKRWIRDAAADADRSTPPLGDMESVYQALVAAQSSSGPALRLGAGVNLIGLDAENRRWLIPRVAERSLGAALDAKTRREARAALRERGAVMFHWSIERTHLVPSPEDASELLPLPRGGKYLVVYQGPCEIVGKPKFREALCALADTYPVADLLVWDTTSDPATLWSLRADLGHRVGEDIDGWAGGVTSQAESLRNTLWTR